MKSTKITLKQDYVTPKIDRTILDVMKLSDELYLTTNQIAERVYIKDSSISESNVREAVKRLLESKQIVQTHYVYGHSKAYRLPVNTIKNYDLKKCFCDEYLNNEVKMRNEVIQARDNYINALIIAAGLMIAAAFIIISHYKF
jgi:DNA-binding Lrp family transcriptional regulator